MTDRDLILNRVRRALEAAHLPAASADLPPRSLPSPQDAGEALADTFAGEALAVGAIVHRPEGRADAIETVLGLVHEAGGPDVLRWDDAHLPLSGLGELLHQAGFRSGEPSLPSDPDSRAARLADLGRAAVGVTGALAGLADTGTLAVLAGPGRSRLASLLPPTHIALLPVSALFPTMAAFFAAHPGVARESSNLVFITGPSRSADIEHTLTIGVHGPKSLHIVLLPETAL